MGTVPGQKTGVLRKNNVQIDRLYVVKSKKIL